MKLSRQEQETIINFNQAEDKAYIYTCSKAWMSHMENRLALKPMRMEPYAREYECPKSWIRKPQKTRKVSQEQKARLRKQLQSNLSQETPCAVGESGGGDGSQLVSQLWGE